MHIIDSTALIVISIGYACVPSPNMRRHLTCAGGECCSCVERDRKFTFKKSDVPSQHLEKLQPGAEVMFTVLPDGPDSDTVISVAVLPPGTISAEQVSPGEPPLAP